MSLFTRRGRVDVSTSDSELDSIASSGDQSPDELIEELARMALAGHYGGRPKTYETNEMLRGHGLARRPRPMDVAASASSAAGPSPPLSVGRETPTAASARSSPPLSARASLQRAPPQAHASSSLSSSLRPRATVPASVGPSTTAAATAEVSRELERMYRRLARDYAAEIHKADAGGGDPRTDTGGDDGRGGSSGDAAADGEEGAKTKKEASGKAKKRRAPDEAAFSRLTTKGKIQEMRQAIPYHKIKEREEEARKHPKRVRVPQKAIVLGRRLHLEAQEKRRTVQEQQEEQEKLRKEEEEKACTFHPTISRYAERLAAREGYYALEDRLDDQAAHDEELQRRRLERAVELEKECTFHPTLSVGTEELVAQQRRRRHSSSGSTHRRRRSRSDSRHRRSRSAQSPPHRQRSSASLASSSHEPFEPGERLYRDGAERLLRQQIRQRRAVARQQHRVIGGQLRLSAEEAADLAQRFASWAASRQQRQEELRAAVERQAREGGGETATKAMERTRSGRVLSRSASARSASTVMPHTHAFKCVSAAASRHDDESGDGPPASLHRSATQAPPPPPPLQSDCLSLSVTRATAKKEDREEREEEPRHSAVVPLRFSAPTSATTMTRSDSAAASCSTSDGGAYWTEATPLDAEARKTQLRIRLGALFYKYAVTPTATTVSPAEVQRQVRRCYPEDVGVAAALASAYDDEHQRLTKTDFMAALARYVAQYGPQPWCVPAGSARHGTHTHQHQRHNTSEAVHSGNDEAAAAAPARQRSGRASPASSTAQKSPAVALQRTHSSAKRSETGDNVRTLDENRGGTKAGQPAIRDTPEKATLSSRAVGSSAGDQSSPVEASSDAPQAVLASSSVVQKPVRTHIYTREPARSFSAPPAFENAALPPAASAEPPKAVARTKKTADGVVHALQRQETKPSPATQSKQRPRQRRRPSPAVRLAATKTPSAELVSGYSGHVARHRRSLEADKPGRSASFSKSGREQEEKEECTFQPTLNRHSVALSELNLEKRTLYARELQLRRQELQLMRDSVLKAASGDAGCGGHGRSTPTPPALSPRPTNACNRAGHRNAPRTPRREPETTTATTAAAPTAQDGVSPLSVSCEVSNSSSAATAVERSGGATASSTPPRQESSSFPDNFKDSPAQAEESRGEKARMKRLTSPPPSSPQSTTTETTKTHTTVAAPAELANDANIHVVPSGPSMTATAQVFRTSKPDKAVLNLEEALTPRHLATRRQRMQAESQ